MPEKATARGQLEALRCQPPPIQGDAGSSRGGWVRGSGGLGFRVRIQLWTAGCPILPHTGLDACVSGLEFNAYRKSGSLVTVSHTHYYRGIRSPKLVFRDLIPQW